MNKEKSLRLLAPFIFFFSLAGCKTGEAPKIVSGEVARLYETKAHIKSASESNTVKIQIALLPQKAIRLEITATLGISLATVLVTPAQIRIALHSTKEFITGPFQDRTLFPVFKQNISPRVLWKIVHDQSPATANLICELNENAKPVVCTGTDGTQLTYSYESAIKRRIDIKNDKFEMNWIFKDQLQLPAYQNETFVLKKPESYKEIVIK